MESNWRQSVYHAGMVNYPVPFFGPNFHYALLCAPLLDGTGWLTSHWEFIPPNTRRIAVVLADEPHKPNSTLNRPYVTGQRFPWGAAVEPDQLP